MDYPIPPIEFLPYIVKAYGYEQVIDWLVSCANGKFPDILPEHHMMAWHLGQCQESIQLSSFYPIDWGDNHV